MTTKPLTPSDLDAIRKRHRDSLDFKRVTGYPASSYYNMEPDIALLLSEIDRRTGTDAFEALGPGVNLTQADVSGYGPEQMWWVWLEKDHGGDGLIYTGATIAEACRKFAAKQGGVDHP